VSQVRVRNFSVSPDGFSTGEGQSLDARRPSSGLGGSTPAAGRADRASLMAQLFKDGTPGTVSHE
jgi:hypothetical protein